MKPDPSYGLNQRAIEEWKRSLVEDEDNALQETKDELRRQHQKQRAKVVMEIIKNTCTPRQVEIFLNYVETGSSRGTGRQLGIDEARVRIVIEKVKNRVHEYQPQESY